VENSRLFGDMKHLFDRRNRWAWLVLALGLLLTTLSWFGLRARTAENAAQQFELHVHDVVDSIEKRMRRHEQILLGGAGLFDASVSVDRAQWRAYIERLRLSDNFPGIQGVGYSQFIRPADLQAHIARVSAEGFPQYAVRPAGERDVYTSVIYLEPFTGRNLAAFGYDMFSEATRAKAMRRAVETGTTNISGKVRLVQEDQGKEQAGFLMYVPIYRKNQPLGTAAERWAAVQGFVFSPYRMHDLMQGILGERKPEVGFSIYDGTVITEPGRMYAMDEGAAPDTGPASPRPRFVANRTIEAYGHAWTVQTYGLPRFEEKFSSRLELGILLLGGSTSVLLFMLVWFLNFRRERATELAEAMTRQTRRNEAALAASVQQTQAILDNVIDGIITIDERGTVASFNIAAEHIFGYAAGEVIGRNVNMLMPEPYHSQHDGYLHNYVSTGVARIIGIGREVQGQRKDGSTFPMDLAVSQITRQDKPLFIGIVRDISERKRVEQMKSEFVSTVSHELRTPLTSIRGALGLIAGGALGPLEGATRQMVDIAYKNSERLTHLINDLLDMEKIAAGQVRFEMQVQELTPLIEEAIEANHAYGEQYQVGFVLREQVDGAQVRVDHQRLLQVLSNLLSNAAKFSPSGAQVEVSVERREGMLRVAVTDHGPGIPAAFRSRVFQKFSQADASDTRKKGGTGLGLAITKELVERMGGRIGFESEEGKGTRFHFELPQWRPASTDGQTAAAVADQPGARRLLVVEDEPDVAQLLAMMLRRAGYNVDVAGDAAEAMQCLQRGTYAALTLDLLLPDQNGISIIRQLRANPATVNLPIIVVSAKVEEGRLAINGDFSAIDWLGKPIDEARLVAAISQALPRDPARKARVLHVEDDADLHRIVSMIGQDVADFDVAHSLAEARAMLPQGRYSLVVLDLGLPDGSGWELLPQLRALDPPPQVIILSASELNAAQARQVEAALVKSRTSNQELLDILGRLIG